MAQIITADNGNKYERTVAKVEDKKGNTQYHVSPLHPCDACPAKRDCDSLLLAHLCMSTTDSKKVFFNLKEV